MPEIGRWKLFVTLKHFDTVGVLSTMQYRNLLEFFYIIVSNYIIRLLWKYVEGEKIWREGVDYQMEN